MIPLNARLTLSAIAPCRIGAGTRAGKGGSAGAHTRDARPGRGRRDKARARVPAPIRHGAIGRLVQAAAMRRIR
jgi:hypothetical protein